jgi:hypothetical protein
VPLTHLYIEKDSPVLYAYLAITGAIYTFRLTNHIGLYILIQFFTKIKPILNKYIEYTVLKINVLSLQPYNIQDERNLLFMNECPR